jgi:hypothetical protein
MKSLNTFPVIFFLTISLTSNAQASFDREFEAIKKELMHWDPIRGEWLANSIIALSDRKPIPDRTFPEDFTPYQMTAMIPSEQRRGISQLIGQSRSVEGNEYSNQWNMVELIFNHSYCSALTGRSFGDPHLKSFDKATYSFQTVGEFIVAKSIKNHFEVQARQSPQDNNFSLNTAVAFNVAGDRLCYYTGEKPDNHFSPWRLDGQPLSLNGRTYFLPHGGTLNLNGRYYTISWPTGENVILESRSGQMGFLNLTIEMFDCDRGEFEGLLGNANGIIEDDFNGRNSSRQRPVYASFSSFGNPMLQQASANAEREYLNFLARDFAEDWRVTDQTTLFDYAIGLTTATYTDRSFPREHFTVSDLPTDRRNASRKKCEDMGISADEMPGCIFDNGFLNLNPSPIPETNNPTRGTVLKSINKPALNNNFATFDENINSTNPLPIVEPIKSKEYNQPIIKDEEPKSIENRPREFIAPNNSFEIKSPKLNKTPNNSISTPNKPSPNEPVQKPSLNGGSIKTKKGK